MWITLLSRFWAIPVILMVLLYAYITHERLTICQLKVDKYEQQIAELAKESKAAQSRVDAVNKKAAEDLRTQERKAQSIMSQDVPKDCMGAMRWGIEQSRAFLNSNGG